MSDLLACQRDVAAALRDAGDAGASVQATRWLAGDATLAAQRLAIYRANVAANADKALSGAYPVLRQLVGEEFFGGLARVYQRATPSCSGNLYDYGGEFADFLASFEHAQSLPYLADLARLEWRVHRAYGAADAEPWDAAALLAVAPERQGEVRFEWAAGTAIVHSAYPIVQIWAIHQPGHAGEFAVDGSRGECALVARDGMRVSVTALADADAAFFSIALAGGTLAAASTAALSADPGLDLGALLARAIASHLICDIAHGKED
jgi:hypothetical protein